MSQTSVAQSGFRVGRPAAAEATLATSGGGSVLMETVAFSGTQLSSHRMTDVAWCHEACAWPHWSVLVVETMYRPSPLVMTEPSSFQP